jgi:adenosylhomocysteine nucleosidase
VITGIVVALPEELNTLTAKKLEKGCSELIAENIRVAYSGVGGENARVSAELLVKQGVSSLISWGCAAALDKSYQPGDLVLASHCIAADKVEINANGQDWLNSVLSMLTPVLASPIKTGKLAESKEVISSSDDKARLGDSTGAVALDMESATIAKVAQLHGLPFLAVRAVADPVTMDLPKAVSHALSDQGEVVLSKLLMFLLLHPSELLGLVKLGLHFKAARDTLKQAAKLLGVITTIPLGSLN